jgi:hypothetical protein
LKNANDITLLNIEIKFEQSETPLLEQVEKNGHSHFIKNENTTRKLADNNREK